MGKKKATTSNAQRTLIPYLKNRGVAKIDQLILTNTNKEHVGDLLEVTNAFHVGEILVSKGSLKQKEFVAELQATQTKVRSVAEGENVLIFGSQLEVLSPRKIGDGDHEDSLVLYGKLLDKNFLFTGNLEEKGEKDLLKQYPDLEVDILKASQHGSKKIIKFSLSRNTQTRVYSYFSWKEQSNETPPSGNLDTTGSYQ